MPLPALTGRVLGACPALLLAHGASSDIDDSFGPILDSLAAHHTVPAPDFPGSGATPRANAPLDPDELADALVDFAHAAAHERFALLGFSTGSPVAIRVAARHPAEATALVLSAGFAKANPRLRLLVRTWRELAATDRRALAAYLVLLGWSAEWLDRRTERDLTDLVDSIAPALPAGADDQLRLLTEIDVRADLPALSLPTLIIDARDDRVVSAAHTEELATIPAARRITLDGGHAIAAEQPEAWATAVEQFLASAG
ncbi:alpha/beta fold hydrolase [Nocardia puris]|uniref:Pimeloyl-ACP methyl ester carboxylesterase n=1 Tax=Nocardia puris TaxID=208602 RepID=A0A366CZN0_9NOCA|nr:alpha/beta fold hydrolase [Nocardia puris]MBF6211954.1 alpha/beta fold hydrolase [Nocardia puris]MBF6366980.1 alpha/beta fold hydrolase [Nocardia puris]MBF6462043.1 alpha/beta fold hydrolase [Nocardia puris]RBO83115.1 pimeloyl-ACP methyl ester carboxylesterase [Nocardia puris]